VADNNGIGENTIFSVQVWLNNSIKRMQSNLAQSKANNTGTLRQALGKNYDNAVMVKGGILTGAIEATDYWGAVDGGRRSGKQPPLNDILKWVKTKLPRGGNDLSTAYLIARKIGEKGTKGNEFASKVMTPKRVDELKDSINKSMREDIIIAINGQID